jgi:hypothetical protein
MTRLIVSLALAIGLAAAGPIACSEPGPAEKAGKDIDDATNEMGKKMDELTEDE